MRRLNEFAKRDDDNDDDDDVGGECDADAALLESEAAADASEFRCDECGCCKNTMVACAAGLERKRVKSAVTIVEIPIAPASLDASTLHGKNNKIKKQTHAVGQQTHRSSKD
jgi:hypothetical protein